MGNRLKGKTAIITGSASGIGRGIAICMAREGASVVICDKDVQGAERVVNEIKADKLCFGSALVTEVDVTDKNSVESAVAVALDAFGRIDILVNNAGMAGDIGDPFPLNTPENWMKVFDTNTISMVRTVQALWPHFTEHQSGRIINIASIVAHWHGDLKMKPAYNASKAGIIALTRTLAIQLAPYNVTVNSISPGLLFTGFWQKLGGQLREMRPEEYPEGIETRDVFLQRVKELVPLGREQTPEDIGQAAVFLASDEAQNITGIDLPVDGGVLAR